jgi:hypothetical protein
MFLVPVELAASTSNAGFDLLLIAHVACAIVGFGALVTSGVQAVRLRRADPRSVPTTLRRYFAPGVNWAGRVLYGVPVFGLLLLADSSGRLRAGDPWVIAGLALWGISAVVAEVVLWPAERRIQTVLAEPGARSAPALARDCHLVASLGGALGLVFVAATVVMVARPH